MVTITNGFTRCGVQFRPPTPPSSSSKEESSYSYTSLFVRFVTTPLQWTMWKICMEPLKGPIDIQRQLAPSSWMIYSKSLTNGVTCNRYVMFTPFMVCKGLFQHLEGLPTDDLNLGVPMIFILKSCGFTGCPIMFPSQVDLWF